jgi:transposase InsO family protein
MVKGAMKQAGSVAGVTLKILCRCAGMSRQNYYKQRRVRQRRRVDESLVVALVKRERCVQAKIGGRKLWKVIKPELVDAEVSMGRDRFFKLLGRHDLLIRSKKRSAKTTNSWHGFGVYPNLAKTMKLTGAHQLLVSDITYIRTRGGFMFLSLVMDSFSRAIVGYNTSAGLEMSGALAALKMAQKQLLQGATPTHHSDRGSQYCCGEYVQQLKDWQMPISMTEQNHCYENAKAERLNGILKQEYGLGEEFADQSMVRLCVDQAVQLYNHRRLHTSLGYQTPMSVHGPAGWIEKLSVGAEPG